MLADHAWSNESPAEEYYAIFDASRDFKLFTMAKLVSKTTVNLFAGDKGNRMAHVAPHLLACQPNHFLAELMLAPSTTGEFGIFADSSASLTEVARHFRKFLLVRRPRGGRPVFFRFFDPRVLRVFLPACTSDELKQFFGPIRMFHCQGDEPGQVLSFSLDGRNLLKGISQWRDFSKLRQGFE